MENQEINKGVVIVIILIIISILCFNTYVLYERYLYDHKNTNETVDNNIDIKNSDIDTNNDYTSIKVDSSLDYVYDADYDSEVSSDTYTISNNTYNINDYKVPYINISSGYATTANQEIENMWNDLVSVFNNGISDGTSYIDKLNYNYNVNGDVLSLFIEYGIGGANAVFTEYKVFNINLRDGSEYTLVDVIKNLDYDLAHFRTKASDNVVNEYDKWYNENDTDGNLKNQFYDEYKEKTLNGFTIDKWFLDSNNNINIIVQIYIPSNTSYYNSIIKVEK